MEKNYRPIKIVLADDHELIRDGFEVMVSRLPDIELVGTATNGQELVALTDSVQPDVVITDIKMPKMNGIQATREIRERHPQINVIALSMFDDESLIIDMLEAGAKGYLLKNAHKSEIEQAVKTVYRDEVYYCGQTTVKLARLIAGSKYNSGKKVARPEFTPREIEVINLISEGLASKEIAERMGLKTRTIESYRERIMEKMNVNNTAGLIVYAIRNGLCKIA
jgi:DNA-binding NarL/FixJ family response regulator